MMVAICGMAPYGMTAAGLIAEQADRPVAVLDQTGGIRLVNRPMERLLRCKADTIVGQNWTRTFLLPREATNADRSLRGALQGLVTEAEMTIACCGEQRIALSLQLQRIGRASDAGLLLVVSSSRAVLDARDEHRSETVYQVSLVASEFGLLIPPGGSSPCSSTCSPEFCYTRHFRRSTPCSDCPARDLAAIGETRVAVHHGTETGSDYLLIRATKLTAVKARIGVRCVQHGEVRLMIEARIDFLAATARLSNRERDVLRVLVLSGDSLGKIATHLGIALGTVKFHVNNLLKKLDADSRVDLQRLLFVSAHPLRPLQPRFDTTSVISP